MNKCLKDGNIMYPVPDYQLEQEDRPARYAGTTSISSPMIVKGTQASALVNN